MAPDVSEPLRALETLVTAATVTARPVDASTHEPLFMSSSQFYEHRIALDPQELQSLNISDAVESLEAIAAKAPPPPMFHPNQQFRQRPLLKPPESPPRSHSRSPPPVSPRVGKIERDE